MKVPVQLKDVLKRYGFALMLASLALFIRAMMAVKEGTSIYQLPIAAVVLSAWYGGRGPGLFACLVSAVGALYLFIPPRYSFVLSPEYVVAFGIFLGLCLLLSEFSSGRRLAELALRASEERFRTLVQFSFDVYWETDAQHRFIRQEFSEGLSPAVRPQDEIGRTRWEIPSVAPGEDAWRKHRADIDAHLPFRDFEIARPTPGGTRHISTSGIPIFDAFGRFVGYRGVGRDITDRKLAEETLRGKDQALQAARTELARVSRLTTLGELTTSIAHEVSQPLGAMMASAGACARWLEADPLALAQARAALDNIVNDGKRARDVIARIRALTRRQAPRENPLDINQEIVEVLALMNHEISCHDIVLRTDLDLTLPSVTGDRVQLQQVLLNLIVNAIEAMSLVHDRPRELTIVSRTGNSNDVLVEVHDRGTGLDPQRIEQVFEPFYTTKPEGIGIGLAISRSIVEAHGGRLWAAAPNDLRGAIFRFSLPVAQAAAA